MRYIKRLYRDNVLTETESMMDNPKKKKRKKKNLEYSHSFRSLVKSMRYFYNALCKFARSFYSSTSYIPFLYLNLNCIIVIRL